MKYLKCSSCRFWEARGDGKTGGSCRVNPPVPLPGTVEHAWSGYLYRFGFWPDTRPDDWCGSYTRRAA